nr:queuosine precursor transporter [Prevotella sp.]
LAPRIAAASFVAFLIGSFANAYVMSKMKIHDGGKRFSLRAILSTVVGESCDSVVFFPLALGGVVPVDELPKLMLWQVVLKTMYEVIALPITVKVVKKMKEHEGEDVYDNGVDYRVWKILSM